MKNKYKSVGYVLRMNGASRKPYDKDKHWGSLANKFNYSSGNILDVMYFSYILKIHMIDITEPLL